MYRYIFDRVYKCKLCGETTKGSSFVFSYPCLLDTSSEEMWKQLMLMATDGLSDSSYLHNCGRGRYGACDFVGLEYCSFKEVLKSG